jgi:hypothetical protein
VRFIQQSSSGLPAAYRTADPHPTLPLLQIRISEQKYRQEQGGGRPDKAEARLAGFTQLCGGEMASLKTQWPSDRQLVCFPLLQAACSFGWHIVQPLIDQ